MIVLLRILNLTKNPVKVLIFQTVKIHVNIQKSEFISWEKDLDCEPQTECHVIIVNIICYDQQQNIYNLIGQLRQTVSDV